MLIMASELFSTPTCRAKLSQLPWLGSLGSTAASARAHEAHCELKIPTDSLQSIRRAPTLSALRAPSSSPFPPRSLLHGHQIFAIQMLMYVRLLLDTRLTHSRCVCLSFQVTTDRR